MAHTLNLALLLGHRLCHQHIVDEVEYYKHAGVTYIKLNNVVYNGRQIFNSYYTELRSLSRYQ